MDGVDVELARVHVREILRKHVLVTQGLHDRRQQHPCAQAVTCAIDPVCWCA